ncbi:MAG: PAS domain S-box protein [Deltaproteobacteria bacterium]|nr:PAS domain S-box protein [Deltaproteobacteria bacterium]
MTDASADDADLTRAARALVARRMPTLTLLNMVATAVWLAILAAADEVPARSALATAAAQLAVLVPAAAACRARPTASWIVPLAVAAFATVGLSWIALFAVTDTSGLVLGFVVFVLYAGVAIGSAWGFGPQFALQGIVTLGWAVALPDLHKRLDPVERIAVAGFGSLITLVIADWAARTFRAAERRRRDRADLTARLQASELRFRSLQEHARDFVWIADLKGRLTYVNPALAHLRDRPAAALLGTTIADLLTDHPGNPPATTWRSDTARVRAGERLPPTVVQVRTATGPRWMETVISPVRDRGGAVIGLHGSSRDVTERRAAAEALRVSEARYRALVEAQDEMVCRFDLGGRFTFVNDTGCRLYGQPRTALLGQPIVHRVHPEDADGVRAAVARASAPPYRSSVESRTLTADGWRWFEWHGVGICDADGVLVEIQSTGRDVTERRAAAETLHASLRDLRASEEKLRFLAQRQVALREEERKRLSFDLHDDVCQELVGIGILVESVRRRLEPLPPDAATDLRRVTRYLNEVTEHLRVLAHELRPSLLLDLGLEGCLRSLAGGLATPETVVQVSFPSPVPRLAETTEVAIYRIAQEALANALRHAHARSVRLELWADAHTIRMEVRDDGCGFEPPRRRHDALGLVSMEERALALGGRLSIDSSPGAGTTVRLECPRAARASESGAA